MRTPAPGTEASGAGEEHRAAGADPCCGDGEALAGIGRRQAGTLRIVLVANAAMFAGEFTVGLIVGSVALLADSLDMLGDALVYGFSLYVVHRGPVWKARAALAKAGVMAVFGLVVLGELIAKLIHPELPHLPGMGAMALVALAANGYCFALLWRHRAEDINMRSVWLCSRNDLLANTGVLAAVALMWLTGSPWPDLIAGALIGALFLRSGAAVAREARAALATS